MTDTSNECLRDGHGRCTGQKAQVTKFRDYGPIEVLREHFRSGTFTMFVGLDRFE
jgi:hypothetical protein